MRFAQLPLDSIWKEIGRIDDQREGRRRKGKGLVAIRQIEVASGANFDRFGKLDPAVGTDHRGTSKDPGRILTMARFRISGLGHL